MLKFPLFASIFLYNGVFWAFGVIVYFLTFFVLQQDKLANFPFFAAFCNTYLAGIISLFTVYFLRKYYKNDIIAVLTGTLVRTAFVAGVIIGVIITQNKNVAFFMLCFSIVFYLGLVPLNVWLTTLPANEKQSPLENHHETR